MKKYQSWSELFDDKNFIYFRKIKKLNNNNLNYIELFKIVYPKINVLQIKKLKKKINSFLLNKHHKTNFKILDYGSGFGCYYFFFKYFNFKYYSYDISNKFLSIQKTIIKNKKNFFILNKKNLKNNYDMIICASVFQYFKNFSEAKKILKFFLNHGNKIILLDIKDTNFQKDYIKYQMKEQKITKEQYKKKYSKTKILFYKKKFFISLLNDFDEFEYKIVKSKYFPGYKFSYDLFIQKKYLT